MRVPEKSFEPEARCPLDGVRVVDLSRLVSGNIERARLLVEREVAITAREARMRSLAGG
jgi:hypothetical protein